jgi:opacity protein-like surface antigen
MKKKIYLIIIALFLTGNIIAQNQANSLIFNVEDTKITANAGLDVTKEITLTLDSCGKIKDLKLVVTFLDEDNEKSPPYAVKCNAPNKINLKLAKKGATKWEFKNNDASYKTFWFDENGKEVPKPSEDSTGKPKHEHPIQIPFPVFHYSKTDALVGNKRNRYLIIDATPSPKDKMNTNLYKVKNTKKELEETNSVHINSSIGVFIRNYNLNSIEVITVNINGTDYTYDEDLSTLYNQDKGSDTDEKSTVAFSGGTDDKDIESYLTKVLAAFKKNKYINVNDLYQLNSYKQRLETAVKSLKKIPATDVISKLSEVLSWQPEYVSLTPIALASVDADEVEIKVSLKSKNDKSTKEYSLGTYRTYGGLGIAVSNHLFFTGLKNNEVYTDSVAIDTTKELRAQIDTENKFAVGIGANSEISFRTGCIVRPTINVGFFIPFEEDISPHIAIGGGFSIGTKKVKFSMSGGLALGTVNSIAKKYREKDLSQYDDLTNENISKKYWDSSWQIGVGVSYNLSKE